MEEVIENKIKVTRESAHMGTRWLQDVFHSLNISEGITNQLILLIEIAVVILFTYVFQWLAKKLIKFILRRIGKIFKFQFADFLLENKFPAYLALIAPLTWIRNTIPIVFETFPSTVDFLVKMTNIFIILLIYWLVNSVVKAASRYLKTFPKYKDKPIDSYFQVGRIVLVIFLIGAFFTVLTNSSMIVFFKGMGAASAVFMLIFRDSILGFVSSILVSINDMLRIGDWITIPKHQADGDVIQITLATVKIKNFDNTITTVPTYSLISDSFQNWRGMKLAGGRRVKRAIFIKQSTIRYIEDKEIANFERIQGIQEYMKARQDTINKYNEETGADRSLRVNGRNMTNIGLYRKYCENYLHVHPNVEQSMIIMVRQQPASENGLPIEIYCFTNTTVWEEYENIMADIFDHLVAAVRYFELEIFERDSTGYHQPINAHGSMNFEQTTDFS